MHHPKADIDRLNVKTKEEEVACHELKRHAKQS
jgi:hypothetical protein